jgi:hypothetical protein
VCVGGGGRLNLKDSGLSPSSLFGILLIILEFKGT